MKSLKMLALVAFAAPAAFAQTTYYTPPRSDVPLAREELRQCMDRDAILASRQSDLDAERRLSDREGQSIARANAQLAEDLRRVDPADAVAVAAHNARTAEHNRRVDAHNLRVDEMNGAARTLNRDNADLQWACSRSYYPRDRDGILIERGQLR